MADRKHADLIRAWLDGAEIEYRSSVSGNWLNASAPEWSSSIEYRIKPTLPAKRYPVTAMTTLGLIGEFTDIMKRDGDNIRAYISEEHLKAFANIVLRHAIDNGQIAPLDAYQQCAKDLLIAEEKIAELNRELIKSKMHALNHGYGT